MISQEHKGQQQKNLYDLKSRQDKSWFSREAEQRRCTEGHTSTLPNFHRTNSEQLLHMIVSKRSRTSG